MRKGYWPLIGCINGRALACGAYFGEASDRLVDRLLHEQLEDGGAEAIDLVEKKRDGSGRWPLENPHAGELHFDMEDGAGKPSRWNTLRPQRVLDWYSTRA